MNDQCCHCHIEMRRSADGDKYICADCGTGFLPTPTPPDALREAALDSAIVDIILITASIDESGNVWGMDTDCGKIEDIKQQAKNILQAALAAAPAPDEKQNGTTTIVTRETPANIKICWQPTTAIPHSK
jgi:hypothetical protein